MQRVRMIHVRFLMCVFVISMIFALPAASIAKQPDNADKAVSIVDINEAGVDTLTTLPGIGGKTAESIIAYRNEHGPFKSVDDLKNVKGIGEKKLVKLKSMATVKNNKAK